MTEDPASRRHSQPSIPDLITDPDEKARAEARNGLLQFDETSQLIETYLDPERPFKLRPSMVYGLHRTALNGITSYAGMHRPGPVSIGESKHVPPPAHLVPAHLEEMCDYVNENWSTRTAAHLAAYVMWRLNWIHPFVDGNGRTSRCVAYLVFAVKAGLHLPGNNTIPEQIEKDRRPYFAALEAADEAHSKGSVDVSKMEELLGKLFAQQLIDAYQQATGVKVDETSLG